MKMKISDEDFEKVYLENTIRKAAFLLNVSTGCIDYHARRLDLSKRDLSSRAVSSKLNPDVIVGGLSSKE